MSKNQQKETSVFVNKYKCEKCGHIWTDLWDSQCDDECSECGTVMTPYESIEVEEGSKMKDNYQCPCCGNFFGTDEMNYNEEEKTLSCPECNCPIIENFHEKKESH